MKLSSIRSGPLWVQALLEQKTNEQRHQNCDDVINILLYNLVFNDEWLSSSERHL